MNTAELEARAKKLDEVVDKITPLVEDYTFEEIGSAFALLLWRLGFHEGQKESTFVVLDDEEEAEAEIEVEITPVPKKVYIN